MHHSNIAASSFSHGAAEPEVCRLLPHHVPLTASISKHPLLYAAPAGNYVVQDIAAAQYCMAPHLPTWAARDIERLKLTADAKMRTAFRLFPAVVRQLHAWRLLTPAYKAFGALGIQVSRCILCCFHAAASWQAAALAAHTYRNAVVLWFWSHSWSNSHSSSAGEVHCCTHSTLLTCCHGGSRLSQTHVACACVPAQADTFAHGGGSPVLRSVGTAASYLLNRLPAAAEAALSGDATFPGAPYLVGGDNHITTGECAATAAPHVALASSQ